MKEYVVKKVPAPKGSKGYNIGESMELFLNSLDFICDEIEKTQKEIKTLRSGH